MSESGVANVRILGVVNVRLANNLTPWKITSYFLKGEQGAGHLLPGHHAHLFGHLDAIHMILVIVVQYT